MGENEKLGVKETWELIAFLIRLGDKIADKAGFVEYMGLLPSLAQAAVGIQEVPAELLDLTEEEREQLKTNGVELAVALELGNDVIYADIEDATEAALRLKNIILRHIKAHGDSTEA